LIERAIEELRKVPEVDRTAIDRVAAAAAASRLSTADDELMHLPAGRRAVWRLAGVVAATIVAVIAGVMLRGAARGGASVRAPLPAAAPPLRPVVATAATAALPIARQFVFNDRTAHSVSVVGDFNGWNPKIAPMMRSPGGDMWSTTVPVLPGRHMFGYMVDDSIFMLDPRMPKTRDPDLGTEGSVVIVGRP
jgi:hypothetical protein